MDISPATRRVHIGFTRSSTWAPRPLQRFSTSSIHPATRVARPPIARSAEKQRQSVPNRVRAPVHANPPPSDAKDLWPTAILRDANRLGLLTITAEKAVEVMRDFEKRHQSSPEQIFKSCLIRYPIPLSLTIPSPQNTISSPATSHYSPASFSVQATQQQPEICSSQPPSSEMNQPSSS